VDANAVVIGSEVFELSVKINRIPEECAVEVFAPNGPDQSLNEGMGDRGVGYRFDLLDLENP
jgi:hypothetical protein